MNSPLPASGPAQRGSWTRRLVNLLVALAVIAVAAAAFVFSYDGVHAIALLGGVSVQLARYYPGLFDAVLVIACVAAVVLRDGRWWGRLWAWLVIFVVLVAIGWTDVVHAANYTLRHRPTEAGSTALDGDDGIESNPFAIAFDGPTVDLRSQPRETVLECHGVVKRFGGIRGYNVLNSN